MITRNDVLEWYCSRGNCGQCENNNWKKCEGYNQLSAMIGELVVGCPDNKLSDNGDIWHGGYNCQAEKVAEWKNKVLNREAGNENIYRQN